ncbi:MAG: hypothetical protein AAGI03_16980 [Pseudomonadota bacterium]
MTKPKITVKEQEYSYNTGERQLWCGGVVVGYLCTAPTRAHAVDGDPEIQAVLDNWLEDYLSEQEAKREEERRRFDEECDAAARKRVENARKALGLS